MYWKVDKGSAGSNQQVENRNIPVKLTCNTCHYHYAGNAHLISSAYLDEDECYTNNTFFRVMICRSNTVLLKYDWQTTWKWLTRPAISMKQSTTSHKWRNRKAVAQPSKTTQKAEVMWGIRMKRRNKRETNNHAPKSHLNKWLGWLSSSTRAPN